ncbi:MAG: class I SAM-dependent methyltransferase [Pseudomonadota bacterium]
MSQTDHGTLMDNVYRHQRFIYDLSRKYFLLGRDHTIEALDVPAGGTVLEVACGTGRNLKRIAKAWPGAQLFGFDISQEMLRTAEGSLTKAGLGDRVKLAQGDACDFDPQALFGVPHFDRIVLSYCLSMIPDWEGALREATRHVPSGGQVAVVDFGMQEGLPKWFAGILSAWLAKFHVSRRATLANAVTTVAEEIGGTVQVTDLYRGYAIHAVITR